MYENFFVTCLYQYNTILLFHYIFVLHNHTKTHKLIFHFIVVLKIQYLNIKFKHRHVYVQVFHHLYS